MAFGLLVALVDLTKVSPLFGQANSRECLLNYTNFIATKSTWNESIIIWKSCGWMGPQKTVEAPHLSVPWSSTQQSTNRQGMKTSLLLAIYVYRVLLVPWLLDCTHWKIPRLIPVYV